VSQESLNTDQSYTSLLQLLCSRQFPLWLQENGISLAMTTYQTSRLILVGVNPQENLSVFERLFKRAMGLFTTPDRLYLSSKYQIWQLNNVLEIGQLYNGYDKLFIPRIGYTTGDLDVHDLANDSTGRIIFVSSILNCLATISDRHSCIPLWKPAFVSQLINEDRCHLNGLAMVDGMPRYVTACSQSDEIDGWRDHRRDGGCVIDVQSQEIIVDHLSMPHSPRMYQGKLWVLNSGHGDFGYIDLRTGKFEPITFCPGYARGLAFWQNFAIVGLSKPRKDKTFSGLLLEERLLTKQADPRCGLIVIDLGRGSIVHWLYLEGIITELYDIQVIAQTKRPMVIGFQTDEIAQLLTLDKPTNLF
jgi:protein O-GlcNAc transferase